MKKTLFIALALMLVLGACNRKTFVKKLVGTYNLNTYIFAGQDKTVGYDTTRRENQLVLDADQVYSQTWKTYTFRKDTLVLADTLSYDSINMVYNINFDTLHLVDTTITPVAVFGKWELINSEEDLQLRSDSDLTNPSIFRILKLSTSELHLLKGNEEFHWKKK